MSPPVKSFYLPLSPFRQLLAWPAQLLFAIAGAMGIANYPRQIVRVVPHSPAKLSTGDGTATDVAEWIGENVPSLAGTYTPSWWLPNGHLQTFFVVYGDFSKVEHVHYTRTYLRLPDDGTISIDIAPPEHETLPADAPTVVVCHGLTGGSHESYVRNILEWVILPVSEGGLGGRGVVVNYRGCAGTPMSTGQLYSAAATRDFNIALHYVRHQFPTSPLHGVGFSLGGAVVANYLGQAGESTLLSSGCVLGTPWDIGKLSTTLEDGWFSSRVYSNALGGNLVKLFGRHYDVNPAIFENDKRIKVHVPELKRLRANPRQIRLKDVDGLSTAIVGGPEPTWPFPTPQAYYAYASPMRMLKRISVPTLAINAFDDPVVAGVDLPIFAFQEATHVVSAITGAGGHLGWFDGPLFGNASKRRWVKKPVTEFLAAAVRDLGPRRQAIQVEAGKDDDERGGGWTWVVLGEGEDEGGADGMGIGGVTKGTRVGWKVQREGQQVIGEDEED